MGSFPLRHKSLPKSSIDFCVGPSGDKLLALMLASLRELVSIVNCTAKEINRAAQGTHIGPIIKKKTRYVQEPDRIFHSSRALTWTIDVFRQCEIRRDNFTA